MKRSLRTSASSTAVVLAVLAGCEPEVAGAPEGAPSAEVSPGDGSAPATAGALASRRFPGLDYVFLPGEPMRHAFRDPATLGATKDGKADQYDDIRFAHPERYAITAPPSVPVRAMVEWEPMRAVVLGVPQYLSGYGNAANTIVQIGKHASSKAEVWYLVPNATTRKNLETNLLAAGMSQATLSSKVRFLETALDSVWFIDYGPLPLLQSGAGSGKGFAFADFRYYHPRPLDDGIPTVLGRALDSLGLASKTVTYRMPVSTEGGTFQSTTDGVCFTGTRQLYYMSCDAGACDASLETAPLATLQTSKYAKELESVWGAYAGCKDVVVTYSITDDGTGHIDMYLKVLDDGRVLMGDYVAPFQNAAQSANAARLDQNAAFLESYVKPGGGGFEVPRLVMPGHRLTNEGPVPFTYVNSTFVNGLNLWPAYTFPDWVASRNQAESTWESALPDYEHVWIDSEELSFWSGAIHCITRTIPDDPAGLWVGDGSCSGTTCQAPAGGYDGACHPNGVATPVCFGPDWLCGCNDCSGPCPGSSGGVSACGAIAYEGCCDGSTLRYCDGGALETGACGTGGCGWDGANGWYDCGFSGSDPTGANPKSCEALECVPKCSGKECGGDGCGGVCGSCTGGETCADFLCVPAEDPCGGITFQGCCDGKLLQYCDGGNVQGGTCPTTCGWNAANAWYDCGFTGADPSGVHPIACDGACTPQCKPKGCGDDGCGGSCGECGPEESCEGGVCVAETPPPGCGDVTFEGCCEGKVLQYCDGGTLQGGTCSTTCGWNAANGWYDCGFSGADPSGAHPVDCDDLGGCVPDCAGKACGPDGCGGTCGTCGAGQACSPAGQCACVPDCAGKVCGGDGCGGSCGACGGDEVCEAGACVEPVDPCGGVTFEGCCDGKTLEYCEEGTVKSATCPTSCGWDAANSWYDCGFSGADPSGDHPIECPGACVPSCGAKVCGGDGCGGSCGTCGPGTACDAAGKCQPVCVPSCAGKSCGGDGCGGLCGTCGPGTTCDGSGKCQPVCTADCAGKECGDDGCGGSCGACAGGSLCNASGECVVACKPKCAGLQCGDDGCGGSCGTCGSGFACKAGQCAALCKPDCSGKACGDDGCGGSCGACAAGDLCKANQCVTPCKPDCSAKVCGDDGCGGICGLCAIDEACEAGACQPIFSCEPDCASKACGDDGCGGSCGECVGGSVCSTLGFCVPPGCAPDCAGKVCGDDGCGGSCGACGGDEACIGGACMVLACTPDCAGRECGDDGCGGSCGDCPAGSACKSGVGLCVSSCAPSCDGKECGDDGCGGSCGACAGNQECNKEGACVLACVPDCAASGAICGDDGCGGSCGDCPAGFVCDDAGLCVEDAAGCVPDCGGRFCGDDGCGGSCGACAPGDLCQNGICVVTAGPEPETDPETEPEDEPESPGPLPASPSKKKSGCAGGGGDASPLALLFAFAVAAGLTRRRFRSQRVL